MLARAAARRDSSAPRARGGAAPGAAPRPKGPLVIVRDADMPGLRRLVEEIGHGRR